MASIGGGSIGSSGKSLIFIIPPGEKIKFNDVDGFTEASIDDKGNIRHRGKIGRTARP